MTKKYGKKTQREVAYTKLFEAMAAFHGIIITYDKDYAALDLGVHMTDPLDPNFVSVTPSRVWFQFKGKDVTALSREQFDKLDHISQSVSIDDLRLWYDYGEPVYLVVYVFAVNKFFAIDITKIIDERWGDRLFKDETFREIKGKRQETITIDIPKTAEVNEDFWNRLVPHRSMRVDGASYQGRPLPHNHDFQARVPEIMEPSLYKRVVDDLLRAHRYRVAESIDAYHLYPESSAAGDDLDLTFGKMYDPYEINHYLSRELVPDDDDYREEGQTFKVQGECAVLIHSDVKSRPDRDKLKQLAQQLEAKGIKNLLVFVNHFMLFNERLVGQKPYNCFPEFSQAFGQTRVKCFVQHLEDLGKTLSLATLVYLSHRKEVPWVDETIIEKVRTGELIVVAPEGHATEQPELIPGEEEPMKKQLPPAE